MKERFCKICGEYFVGVTNVCYCSESCRTESLRMQNEDKVMKKRLQYENKKKPPNKLDEIMRECTKQGISYSEWKKKKTLEEVGKVQL